MSFGIIYKVTNIINNKIYIGQTTSTLKKRWQGHIFSTRHDDRCLNNYFHNAIRKYGENSFEFIQIDTANSKEELNSKERYWIMYYKSNIKKFGYNSTSGGDSCGKLNQEVKNKIGLANKGNKYCVGRIISKETREKLSKSLKNSEKYKASVIKKSRKFHCFELNETLTYREFCEKYPDKKFNLTGIVTCCLGKQATSCSLHWCYAEDIDIYKIKEIHDNRKAVYCVETKESFKSITEAKKKYPQCSCLEECCYDIRKSAGGLHWCFLKDKDTYTISPRQDRKEVYCQELDKIYESGAEAARVLNLGRNSITRICRKNKQKQQLFYTLHGYHFCFAIDKNLLLN